jgi:hypothetical protein
LAYGKNNPLPSHRYDTEQVIDNDTSTMKFSLALISTLLASAASADYLEQNTLCGDSKECTNNCRDGRYHIVTDSSGSVHFGCSVKANNPLKYANPDCSFSLGDGPEETSKSQATCDTVSGTLCRSTFKLEPKFVNYCVMLDKDFAAYTENCAAAKGVVRENHRDFGSYEILVDSCE